MRKLLVLVFLAGFYVYPQFTSIQAASNNTDSEDVVLPQDESEVKNSENPNLQQISSPQFFSEDNSQSFVKGIGVGFILGIIIGGVVVWFYKKKLS